MADDPVKIRDVAKLEIVEKKDKDAGTDNDNQEREGSEPKD